jgi:toxin ParE1/3/4
MTLIALNRVWPEVLAAAEWYAKESPQSAARFVLAFYAAKQSIREFPFRYPAVFQDVRRAQMGDFPYGVFYVVRDNEATIFAVVHMHRHPRHWQRWIPRIRRPRH